MRKLIRHNIVIALLFAFVIAVSAHLAHLSSAGGSDDNLLFYMNGLDLFHGDQTDALNRRAIEHYKTHGGSRHAVLRLEMHHKFLNEFVFMGTVVYAVSRSIKSIFDPWPEIYPVYLALVFAFGFFFNFVILLGLLIAVFAYIGRPIFAWALVAALALVGLSELLPVKGHAYAAALLFENPLDAISRLFDLLVHPGVNFSALSYPPRSNIGLMLIGVFALRWSGRPFGAYLLVFALSLVHIGTSGLVLAVLVGTDLMIRPQIFRRPAISSLIVVAVAAVAIRENMFLLIVGKQPLVAAGIAGALCLLGGVALMVWKRTGGVAPGLIRPYMRARGWLLRQGSIGADLIVLTVLWVTSLLIIYVMIHPLHLFEPAETIYFWGRVNGRVMLMLVPSMIFGLCLLGIGSLAARASAFRRRAAWLLPTLAVVPVAVLIANATMEMRSKTVLKNIARDLIGAEKQLETGTLPGIGGESIPKLGKSEQVLYYAIVKTIDSRTDVLKRIMP